MKKTVWLILAMLFVLVMSGCPTTNDLGGEQQGTGKYAKEFRGEWIRMDTGDRWYISGNSITVNGGDSPHNVTLKKSSENVTLATVGNKEYTLFAARIANASFKARVVVLDDKARSVTGRAASGDIKVDPRNPKDPDWKPGPIEPDPVTGEITVPDVIPGDIIEMTPHSSEWGDIKVELTPGFGDDQNLGVIPLTLGDNFKVSLLDDYSNLDLYADGSVLECGFVLENIGKTNCGDGGWELSWDDNDFSRANGYGVVKGDFANIAPGGKKYLSVDLRSNPIDTERKSKEIKISIWNYDTVSKKVRDWEDTVSINFYSAPVPFRLRSEKQVQGVIKAKNGKSYYFKTERQGEAGDFTTTVNVPWSLDEYTIAFLGASIESGSATKYSFAVDDQPPADWGSLRPIDFLRKYKPANEYEDTAPVLDLTSGEKSFMGYLAGDSIDYYKVKLDREMPVSAKIIDLEDWAFEDQPGVSVDGKANPGETLNFDFKLKNVSLQNRTVYISSLTADSSYVQDNYGGRSITLQPGYYGSTGSGKTSLVSSEVPLFDSNNTSYYRQIKLASNCPEGPLQLTLKFSDNTGIQYEKKITIQVYLPENLSAPTNLRAEYPSENSVRLSWDKVTGAQGYHVYVDDVLQPALSGDTTQYDRSGLDANTSYSFKVCAVKNGIEQGFSSLSIRASGSVLVFNRRNEFYRDDFYNGNWDVMRAFYTSIYVVGGANYRFLTEGVTISIKYEDTPANEDPLFWTASSSQPSSKIWEVPRSGWVRIKFSEIYTDVFSLSVIHPEKAVNAFSINGTVGAVGIDEFDKTITILVQADTDLTNVTPVISPASGWTCDTSGAKNFTNPVEYIFSKGNIRQAYTVKVNK